MRLPDFTAEASLYRTAEDYIAYSAKTPSSLTIQMIRQGVGWQDWALGSSLPLPPWCPIVCDEWGHCAPACPTQT